MPRCYYLHHRPFDYFWTQSPFNIAIAPCFPLKSPIAVASARYFSHNPHQIWATHGNKQRSAHLSILARSLIVTFKFIAETRARTAHTWVALKRFGMISEKSPLSA